MTNFALAIIAAAGLIVFGSVVVFAAPPPSCSLNAACLRHTTAAPYQSSTELQTSPSCFNDLERHVLDDRSLMPADFFR